MKTYRFTVLIERDEDGVEAYLNRAVVEELLSEADQRDSLVAGPAKSEIDAAASWLDAVAQDMAQAITVAEQDVPETEHREWFKVMAAAVKPLEENDA